MAKPLTLKQLNTHQGATWVEFRIYPTANGFQYCVLEALCWVGRVLYDHSRREYLKDWRCWESKPTKEEMEAAKWEN